MRINVVALAALSTRWSHKSASSPRNLAPRLATDDATLTQAELKEELADLLADVPARGDGVPDDDAADLLEIVADLEPLNPNPEWDLAPCLKGEWSLAYTSSKAFHTNQGLIGYAQQLKGVSTPRLLMEVQTQYRLVTFIEPIQYEQGSMAGFFGGLAKAEAVSAECSWSKNAAGAFLVTSSRISAGGRSWDPADKQAKALRVLAACTPAYLDDDFLIFRAQIPTVIFVFERA